jgi:hypothetical protein
MAGFRVFGENPCPLNDVILSGATGGSEAEGTRIADALLALRKQGRFFTPHSR